MIALFENITLDKGSKTSLYQQLYEKLKEMIFDGVLSADFRLPAIRPFASALQVNQVTVVSAYRLLENEKYVYTKPGSGIYVANIIPMLNNSTPSQHSTLIIDEVYPQEELSLGVSQQINVTAQTINFASAAPTSDLFPIEDFKIAMNEVLDRDKGNAFAYQESQGFPPIRESIASLLLPSIPSVVPENIQIISGAQQGIDIISKALLRQGDYVLTENPTYSGAIAVFKSRGAEIESVEMSTDGPCLSMMEYYLKKYKPKLIYCIPSFQNPTGYSYSQHKRAELLKLANQYHAYIIEDDYVSDLDFDERQYTPLKAMDKFDRVIYIKSFSKIFMPGLRLGFMLVPDVLQASISEAKHTTDISTSGLIQRAFDLYIRKGYWDKHFQFMYNIYKERYLRITAALDENLPPDILYHKPGGGLNLWLQLPFGFPVNSLFKQALAQNIVFSPGKIFYGSDSVQKNNHIRLSYASLYQEQIEPGIHTLCNMTKRLLSKHEVSHKMPIL